MVWSQSGLGCGRDPGSVHPPGIWSPTMTRSVAVAALVCFLTACGTDDASPPRDAALEEPVPSSSVSAPTDDLKTAVRAYSDAYLNGRTDGYNGLSARCRGRVTLAAFVTAAERARDQYGPQPIKTLAVDRRAGDLAWVTYTYADAPLDQRNQPWVREGSTWRIDEC